VTKGSVRITIERPASNAIEAAAAGATDGLQLALTVGAMLIAFIALIAMCNAVLTWLGDVTGANAPLMTAYGQPLSLQLIFGVVLQYSCLCHRRPLVRGTPCRLRDRDETRPERVCRIHRSCCADLRPQDRVGEGDHDCYVLFVRVRQLFFHRHSNRRHQSAWRRSDEKTSPPSASGRFLGGTLANLMTATIAGMFFGS